MPYIESKPNNPEPAYNPLPEDKSVFGGKPQARVSDIHHSLEKDHQVRQDLAHELKTSNLYSPEMNAAMEQIKENMPQSGDFYRSKAKEIVEQIKNSDAPKSKETSNFLKKFFGVE